MPEIDCLVSDSQSLNPHQLLSCVELDFLLVSLGLTLWWPWCLQGLPTLSTFAHSFSISEAIRVLLEWGALWIHQSESQEVSIQGPIKQYGRVFEPPWQPSPGQLAHKSSLRICPFKVKNGLAYSCQWEAKRASFKSTTVYTCFSGSRRLRRV